MEDFKTGKNSKTFYIVFGILVIISSFLVVSLNELALVYKISDFENIPKFLDVFFTIYIIVIVYQINKKNFKYVNFNFFVSILGFFHATSFIYFHRIYKINGGIVSLSTVSNMFTYFLMIIHFLLMKNEYKGKISEEKGESL